ncbi:MAG: hypothetical protein L0H64_03380 [Pseudonocardia sp.]|nr:hypothetical protein [Pseudonocardia sp.]
MQMLGRIGDRLLRRATRVAGRFVACRLTVDLLLVAALSADLVRGADTVVLFGVCVVLVATASGVLGDLWDGGTQGGADGSTESTAAGAAVGIVAVAVGIVPWAVLPEPASWVAGPALAVLLLGGAAVLLDRKVLG